MTPDGVRIRAYLIIFDEAPHERPTVLMLHANAGNVGDRLSISRIFRQRMRCNVLALSYRGYGKSEGTANENGIRLDAQTALDYILSHPQLDKTAIFLYGQSIGGAVAIDLASRNAQRIAGLIVENTFLSLPQLVSHLMPYLRPFLPLLLNQIWPSVDKVAAFPDSLPVCFLSGSKDDLIPPSHMNELHHLSGGKKEIHRFPEGTHSECYRTTFDLANLHQTTPAHSRATFRPLPPSSHPSSVPRAPRPLPSRVRRPLFDRSRQSRRRPPRRTARSSSSTTCRRRASS